MIFARTEYWALERRLRSMTEASSSERGADVRFPPPLIFLVWTLAGVAVRYAFVPAPVPFTQTISVVVGLLVLLIGAGIVASARIHFTRTGQSPIPWKPSPELILQGPYRFTRNPMYVGVTTIQIGLGLVFNNLWISSFAPLALLTVHFVAVLPEERYLSENSARAIRHI
jgi:protein-S-isoprenylcysteine O-methyltransferase Ste14